ncbi:zinc finger protein sens-like [Rhopilema esculentum]|uniref:zinc finger protein sens-like n=1 Tax=Rhopilema esculentum TaxID=499914 RepID=UPI0031D047AA|eukprot:gene12368-3024_t
MEAVVSKSSFNFNRRRRRKLKVMAGCRSPDTDYYISKDDAICGKDYFHEYLCWWMTALMQAKGYGVEATEKSAKHYQHAFVARENLQTPNRAVGGWLSKQMEAEDRILMEEYELLKEYHNTERRQVLLPLHAGSPLNRQQPQQQQQQQEGIDTRFTRKRVHGPYTCEDCGKVLKRSSSLSNHKLIHKNVKAFCCEKCGTRFLRKSDLGKHYAIHTGSKPYVCNVCDKSFSQSSNMLTHKRRHTGVKPYKCNFCSKSFYRKVDVKRHEIVHNISESE